MSTIDEKMKGKRIITYRVLEKCDFEIDDGFNVYVDESKYGRILHDGQLRKYSDGELESLIDFLDSMYRNSRKAIIKIIKNAIGHNKKSNGYE